MRTKIFTLMILLCATLSAQTGIVYQLPRTKLEISVRATRTIHHTGPLGAYAQQYLRMKVSPVETTIWKIDDITVKSLGTPDPERAYSAEVKDKDVASHVQLTPDGRIIAVNSPLQKYTMPENEEDENTDDFIDPRPHMTEEILSATSEAKTAELAAKEIYNIRESRNAITSGQADYMPQDGTAMKLMLDNLDMRERALTGLFAGWDETYSTTRNFSYSPKEPEEGFIIFRFSPSYGILQPDDLSGEPYLLEVKNIDPLPVTVPKEEARKEKQAGVIYNIPGNAMVAISHRGENLFEEILPVTQFGTTEVLVKAMFKLKNNTSVIFDPETGSILKID